MEREEPVAAEVEAELAEDDVALVEETTAVTELLVVDALNTLKDTFADVWTVAERSAVAVLEGLGADDEAWATVLDAVALTVDTTGLELSECEVFVPILSFDEVEDASRH